MTKPKENMSDLIFHEELRLEKVRLVDILPELELTAKYLGLKLNRAKEFKIVKRHYLKLIYSN